VVDGGEFPTAAMSLISLRDLTIGYPRRSIASGISIDIAAGQALGVLGPNGSGKTTLFCTVLGLLAPLAGRVELDGRLITAMGAADIARRIAYVPQIAASLFNFSVIEVVEMARAPHLGWFGRPGCHDRQIALDALAQVSMTAFAERDFAELSGGERQLVLIARALASEANCLLLDEPTASLDFGNQLLVLDALVALKSSGLAVIFTTHDPEHAARVCSGAVDRILTISRTGHAEIGTPADVMQPKALAALYGISVNVFTTRHAAQPMISD